MIADAAIISGQGITEGYCELVEATDTSDEADRVREWWLHHTGVNVMRV
jgi:hypothetical protein